MNTFQKISTTLFLIIFLFSIFCLSFTQASSPQFMVSWQAKTYVPSWYQGKIFPTKDSMVEVRFELIDNNKIADLSREKIRWYVNDDLMKNEENGLGIKSLKFLMPDYPSQTSEVRIQIFHYKNGEILDKIIRIPSMSPEIVIDSAYPNNEINVGSSIFYAWPFFFNVANLNQLSIDWSAMGEKAENYEGDPWQMNLEIDQKMPKGTEINISAFVKNIFEDLEFARKETRARVR